MKDFKTEAEEILGQYRLGVEWLNNDEDTAGGKVLSHAEALDALYQLHLEGVREIENYFNRQGDFLIKDPFDHESMIEVFDKKDILEFLAKLNYSPVKETEVSK